MLAQIKRSLRNKWPRVAQYVQTRPRFSVKCERAAMLSQLHGAGAREQDLKRIRGELAEIESALSPEAFADYAGPLLPIAHAEGGREWL